MTAFVQKTWIYYGKITIHMQILTFE